MTVKRMLAKNMNPKPSSKLDPGPDVKIVLDILNALVKEIPKISRKNARKKKDAKYHALKKAAESVEQRKQRLEKEAKAQALKRSLEDDFDHQARLIREHNCQLARYEGALENPDLPDEYFEKRLAID